MIDWNQDRLYKQSVEVEETDDIESFVKPLANGDVGVCVFNRADATQ